jgi:hypothetical protein
MANAPLDVNNLSPEQHAAMWNYIQKGGAAPPGMENYQSPKVQDVTPPGGFAANQPPPMPALPQGVQGGQSLPQAAQAMGLPANTGFQPMASRPMQAGSGVVQAGPAVNQPGNFSIAGPGGPGSAGSMAYSTTGPAPGSQPPTGGASNPMSSFENFLASQKLGATASFPDVQQQAMQDFLRLAPLAQGQQAQDTARTLGLGNLGVSQGQLDAQRALANHTITNDSLRSRAVEAGIQAGKSLPQLQSEQDTRNSLLPQQAAPFPNSPGMGPQAGPPQSGPGGAPSPNIPIRPPAPVAPGDARKAALGRMGLGDISTRLQTDLSGKGKTLDALRAIRAQIGDKGVSQNRAAILEALKSANPAAIEELKSHSTSNWATGVARVPGAAVKSLWDFAMGKDDLNFSNDINQPLFQNPNSEEAKENGFIRGLIGQ